MKIIGFVVQHLKYQRILMCCECSQISFDTTSEGMFPMSITKPCSYLGIKSSGKSELTAFFVYCSIQLVLSVVANFKLSKIPFV